MYRTRCTLGRGLVANRVVDEEGRYDYDHKSEDENTRKESQIRNQLSSYSRVADHSARRNMGWPGADCRRLSKRASAPVELERDHGIRRCPGLRMFIARAIFCVCAVLHTSTNRVLSMSGVLCILRVYRGDSRLAQRSHCIAGLKMKSCCQSCL
jgi:hypothetical protein